MKIERRVKFCFHSSRANWLEKTRKCSRMNASEWTACFKSIKDILNGIPRWELFVTQFQWHALYFARFYLLEALKTFKLFKFFLKMVRSIGFCANSRNDYCVCGGLELIENSFEIERKWQEGFFTEQKEK